MSVVRYQLSNLSKAIEYELKALDIVKNIGNKRGESVCYINLGLDGNGQVSNDIINSLSIFLFQRMRLLACL
jgi:hypothetical protein